LGHEVLLDQSMDSDTIVLNLRRPDKSHVIALNDSVKRTWFYDITYPRKYRYMGFFDSLANLHGSLGRIGGGYTFKELNQNVTGYLAKVNTVYADRLRFYYHFIDSYYMPAILKDIVLKEIQYSYFDDLMDPLVAWNGKLIKDYPKAIQDTIAKLGHHLKDSVSFENTSFYRRVLTDYMYLTGFQNGPVTSLTDPVDSTFIINRMIFCKNNMEGVCKNYILASLMKTCTRVNLPGAYVALYNNYDHNNSTPGTNKLVDSLYSIVMHMGNMSEEEVLNLSFEDKNHISHKLKAVINNDIILLDCWATWCVPCRDQIPALDSLAIKYKNRVQFIAISADMAENKWDTWLEKEHGGDKKILQLHASKGFENIFFRRLMISAIPRYILISKTGKILNVEMPVPSAQEAFTKELDRYLN